MLILILAFVAVALKVLAQSPSLSAQDASSAYPDLNATNLIGTRLYGFDGCFDTCEANIREAYDDFETLSNTEGVLSNIDWNSAAALEYLGPAGFNKNQQSQIQAVFANAATVYPGSIFNPLSWYVRARCDDPLKKCADDAGNDPCDPPQNPPPETPKPSLNAYSHNKDPTDPRYPMVNFCKRFFEQKRSLTNTYAFGSSQPGAAKFDISNYANRAETMFHELLHLDLVADSAGGNPNPVVDDMSITYSFRASTGKDVIREDTAYGPTRSKLLARFKPDRGDFATGYYVQRNSDNLVFYSLAKYIQGKLGIYPHIPVIREFKLTLPPYKKPNTVVEYKSINDRALLMQDAPIEPVPGCNDRLDDDASSTNLTLGVPYDDSDYPSNYVVQVAQWLGDFFDAPAAGQPSPPRCQSAALTDDIHSVSRAEAADKIQQFCSNKDWWDVKIVPAVTFGDGAGHKALGVSDNFTVNGGADSLHLDVSWEPGCMGGSLFTAGATDDDKMSHCTTRFLTILDGCDTASTDTKIGAVAANTNEPFTVFTGGPQISCSDADASIEPNFSNACSYFYTGEPETVALFDKPAAGGCASLTTPPATTFQEQPTAAAKRDALPDHTRAHPRDVARRT